VVSKEATSNNEWRQESARARQNKPRTLNDIETSGDIRWNSGDQELNRVLGGGVVPGSLILIGGEPGIGKSTLMLQAGLRLKTQTVLYVSGEESEQQIKMRAERLNDSSPSCFLKNQKNKKKNFKAK
jgi:DNA repair protein RadA/Sms